MSQSNNNPCISNDDNTSLSNKNQQPDGLSIFCREVRNLLRSKPNCMIPFSKFVPSYHNHYGRQCCVYQFGYTKLIELLESIPHVVQIIGDGTNRYITLTHREQIKRFASDLIKVVKSQPGKKLKLSQFARAYEQVLGRTFRVEDYGTNNINVLLAEIWEGTINIMPIKREFVDESVTGPLFVHADHCNSNNNRGSNNNSPFNNSCDISSNHEQRSNMTSTATTSSMANSNRASSASSLQSSSVSSNELLVNKPYITVQYPDAWFEIPKRERSDKEIKRTKYFVWDVIELLSNLEPDYSVPFSKFIPSYHYYFNRQCKVSIFGFSKLIDLFEYISPEVVEIVDQGPGEEKIIRLAKQHWPIYNNRNHGNQISGGSGGPLNSSNSNKNSNSNHHHSRRHDNAHPIQKSNNKQHHDNDHHHYDKQYDIVDEDDDYEEDVDVDEEDVDLDLDEEDDDEFEGDDVIVPIQAIDSGPTEEELVELEEEIRAYEELQSRKSSRMAAILDVFKYSIY